MGVPFLPLFIFDGPKRPRVKRGRRISGERHWLVDSMKGIIEAFGFEWRMVRSSLFIIPGHSSDRLVGPQRGGSRTCPPEWYRCHRCGLIRRR
jgi:Holliday junction resolvase YEN1